MELLELVLHLVDRCGRSPTAETLFLMLGPRLQASRRCCSKQATRTHSPGVLVHRNRELAGSLESEPRAGSSVQGRGAHRREDGVDAGRRARREEMVLRSVFMFSSPPSLHVSFITLIWRGGNGGPGSN